MAIVALRSKRTGKVHHLSDTYLRVFPDSWEPAAQAVDDGLVEKETDKVVKEVNPTPARAGKSPKKKEAPDA